MLINGVRERFLTNIANDEQLRNYVNEENNDDDIVFNYSEDLITNLMHDYSSDDDPDLVALNEQRMNRIQNIAEGLAPF